MLLFEIFTADLKLTFINLGINTGSFYAISTLLNQEILDSYPVSIPILLVKKFHESST